MIPVAGLGAARALARRLAAPSCVLPAGVAENARFLAGRVGEVGLCLFETRACLGYGPADLPPCLAALPLRWHTHLPTDLPWPARAASAHPAQRAARAALGVLERVAFLRPGFAVLHPPAGSPAAQRRLLRGFLHHWRQASATPVLVENIACCDVAGLGEGFLEEAGAGLCLDVGHLLGYGQDVLLHSPLPGQARLLHWSAPGGGDRHLPLTAFSPRERDVAKALARRLPKGATHMVEVFNWPGIAASLPVLARLLQPSHP